MASHNIDISRSLAERMVQRLLVASAVLNETVSLVQAEASEAVFEDHRRRTAEVMASIYLDLIKPITSSYPDLDPGGEG
jgi:hypothetical protein